MEVETIFIAHTHTVLHTKLRTLSPYPNCVSGDVQLGNYNKLTESRNNLC